MYGTGLFLIPYENHHRLRLLATGDPTVASRRPTKCGLRNAPYIHERCIVFRPENATLSILPYLSTHSI